MNMLIIGNGFDLAHGRPTTYGDFLKFVGQISRTRDYHGTKKQFEETMPDLHSEVRKYILSAIDTKVNYRNAVAGNSNPVIQEMYECLDENVWYEYFQVIVREDKIRGKNWIDFESEILEVIKFFDEKFNDLYEPLPAQSKDFGVFNNDLGVKSPPTKTTHPALSPNSSQTSYLRPCSRRVQGAITPYSGKNGALHPLPSPVAEKGD